jgi:hypothetical protein
VYTAFADFETTNELLYRKDQEVFSAFTVFILTLFMLNLLVGVLSNELEKVLDSQKETDYAAKCEILLDLENTMFWVCSNR